MRTPSDAPLSSAMGVLNLQVSINDSVVTGATFEEDLSGKSTPLASAMASAEPVAPSAEGVAPAKQEAAQTIMELLSMPAPPRMAAQSMVLGSLSEGLAGQPAECAGSDTEGGKHNAAAADDKADADAEDADSTGSADTTGSMVDDIVKHAGVSPACTLVWYFARRNFGSQERFLEVSCRPLSILRPGKDLIALPIGFPVVMDLWMWAVERFGYQLWQALWYPAPLQKNPETGAASLDIGFVHAKVVEAVRTMFRGRLKSVLLIPFQKARGLHALCAKYNIPTFGDTFEGLTIKDCLHPRPWDGASSVPTTYLMHPKTGEQTDVRVPRGFTCVDKDELVAADTALRAAGVAGVVLKPSWSSSGSGIVVNISAEDVASYEWNITKGSIVLEEFLEVDVDPSDGKARWPVVHFLARSRCGEVVEQLIAGTTSYNGTVSPSDINSVVEARVLAVSTTLAEVFGFNGFWGIDLLVHKGEPYLIDLNSGRPNGGHVPKIFVSLHAPNQPFKFWKEKHVASDLTAAKLHGAFIKAGLAFTSKEKRGLIILHVFPGVIATIMAIGRNKKDLAALLAQWDAHRTDIIGADVVDHS